ncbi:B12-binding domain-containing radical SAM protein [Magnetospirillum moscoviense]|uniref:Uncharacterized protein n=1 Tax=Magnetospirillum moscoviense TaxID=1437059 RepID=A0A178MA30_9PROT|nr:radical SAM protein [Magnetospirillum moscoviense]OAN45383.1 hypothetical protein A6A05_04490 [Magnetospirillum moscoviense]
MKIAFIDLTHTGRYVHAINFSLGIGYVAAHAIRELGDVEAALFKYPNDLAAYLHHTTPDIMAFSNYMWNETLHRAFCQRVKAAHPQVVTIFGGPSFSSSAAEQRAFLAERPDIDFYIEGEGELAFTALCRRLREVDFDAEALKRAPGQLPNARYLIDGELVACSMAPRILDLDSTLPSPYLTGLLDPFFDGKLTPMVQTSRGCPYSCTYCHDGVAYMNKTRRFSQSRIEQELDYVFTRTNVPSITLADLNWGIFPEDVETARWMAAKKASHGWPRNIGSATAKNQKTRMLEMAQVLGDSLAVGASVQSTDPEVLGAIKRANISIDSIVETAREVRRTGSRTFSEVILCLPGDTREKHLASIRDMMDAGIQDIQTFQFILLPGTEAADQASQEKYRYVTRHRVLPGCIGRYDILGDQVFVAETHQVCVANATMSHDDYLECRDYHLTIAIFNNGGLFDEVLGLAESIGIKRSAIMRRIHRQASAVTSPLADLYRQYREDEARNFHPDRQTIQAFLATPEAADGYMSGHYGNNQIFWCKTAAVFDKFDELAAICFDAIREMAADHDGLVAQFIADLWNVVMARKSNLLDVDRVYEFEVTFDFQKAAARNYLCHPKDTRLDRPRTCTIRHSEENRRIITSYYNQYGRSADGLSYFLHRDRMHALFRQIADIA